FGAEAFEGMRRATRHEHRIAGAERQRLVAELKIEAPRADDEGLVVVRMPMQPGARLRRLDRLAQRISAARLGHAGLERKRDPAELIALAAGRREMSGLRA